MRDTLLIFFGMIVVLLLARVVVALIQILRLVAVLLRYAFLFGGAIVVLFVIGLLLKRYVFDRKRRAKRRITRSLSHGQVREALRAYADAYLQGMPAGLLIEENGRHAQPAGGARRTGHLSSDRNGTVEADAHRSPLHDDLERLLADALPCGRTKTLVITATAQLLLLKKSLPIAERAGVPHTIIEPLADETDNALGAILTTAQQLAAVHAQGVTFDHLQPTIDAHHERLERIVHASEHTRTALGRWTIRSADGQVLEEADIRFTTLTDATHELMELW